MRNATPSGWIARFPVLLLGAAAVAPAGCSDDSTAAGAAGPSDSEVKAPYGPPSRDTVSSYQRKRSDGSTFDMTTRVVGDKTLGGASYWRDQIGDFGSATKRGVEAWIRLPDPNTLVAAGGEIWSTRTLPNPNPSQPSVILEPSSPVTVSLSPPVGQAQNVSVTGTVTILGQPLTVTATGTYTLVSDNETVETQVGTLHGCRHFTGSGSTSSSEVKTLLGGSDASAEVWYHPSFGPVRGVLRVPGRPDTEYDFLGTQEMGQPTSGFHRIQGMRVLRTLERFDLNTYDVRGQFDADKDTHAKMLIEARFLDESRAKTQDRPPVETDFGTAMGVFPHQLVASPVSFFHPEENGLGMTYWIAFVDQAAKNEPSNGISYHVTARVPDYGSSPVRVTSRIIYRIYAP